MPCVYSSRMVKNYRFCPIRIEIIHDRHRVVQIFTLGVKFKNIKVQLMCKFAQLYACYELFLKYNTFTVILQVQGFIDIWKKEKKQGAFQISSYYDFSLVYAHS
jgi:hypothetical protein